MKRIFIFFIILEVLVGSLNIYAAQDVVDRNLANPAAIFDDKMLFTGYVEKYKTEPKKVLLAMMNDSTLGQFKIAAAVRVFKENFADNIVSTEKNFFEKVLLRLMAHEDSSFVQVEIMHTLIVLDRYRYFKIMVPRLVEKLDHYNDAVVDMAYDDLTDLINKSTARIREARIIFTTLRKVLFLSRKKLAVVQEPDEKLQKKLDLLFWSIKVLGKQELRQLPPEVIRLL